MSLYFNKKDSAVLVIDLQKSVSSDKDSWAVEDYDTVLKNAETCIDACREADIPIIYAAYELDPNGMDKMKYEPVDSTGRPLHSVRGDKETEICDEVKPEIDDVIFTKQKFSAWYGTKLDIILSNLGINHLIVFGIWTEACLETTVWDAIWRDYQITLVKDACGSATNDMHKIAVLDMANWLYGGSIINSTELSKALNGQDYKVWHFEKPAQFLYTLDTVNSMYKSLDDRISFQ
ncbi:cysteine hydrolase family protein [Natranaerofaba carboxydovora]|uniref:cysteine hydrolase family protein n=1 Tax=Natranaerofaba carboxydovora TaxID=2742683 RepID=UPI001F12EC6F|nr:cysteine hydrolase [Natranaerofaba carboxydovora]